MLTDEERRFHANRLHVRRRRAGRRAAIWISAEAIAYFAGHLIGRALHHANEFAHRPKRPFNLFGG